MNNNLQINDQGKLKHLLQISLLSQDDLLSILELANTFITKTGTSFVRQALLHNTCLANLFFEPSTRTRCSFELAAKYLSATVINLDIATSSAVKGETVIDTVRNLEEMGVDLFVVRHKEEGTLDLLAQHIKPTTSLINAGDGKREHPTQALLDIFTIRKHKPNLQNLKVVIIGDIAHSRVAHSLIYGLNKLGVGQIVVSAPEKLLPKREANLAITVCDNLQDALPNADVIVTLRIQHERIQQDTNINIEEFIKTYGLTQQKLKLAKPDAIVMHPGPMNRGVEITNEVADGPQSVILQQVHYGVAVRMAVMAILRQ